jgi:hypothetical protein
MAPPRTDWRVLADDVSDDILQVLDEAVRANVPTVNDSMVTSAHSKDRPVVLVAPLRKSDAELLESVLGPPPRSIAGSSRAQNEHTPGKQIAVFERP